MFKAGNFLFLHCFNVSQILICSAFIVIVLEILKFLFMFLLSHKSYLIQSLLIFKWKGFFAFGILLLLSHITLWPEGDVCHFCLWKLLVHYLCPRVWLSFVNVLCVLERTVYSLLLKYSVQCISTKSTLVIISKSFISLLIFGCLISLMLSDMLKPLIITVSSSYCISCNLCFI